MLFSGWTPIPAGTMITAESDEVHSFQLKTVGSGHFDIHFSPSGAFECELTSSTTSIKFDLHSCTDGPEDCCMMRNIPTGYTRIWTFSLSTLSNELYLECEANGVSRRVMTVSQSRLSSCLTVEQFHNFLSKVEVYSDDTVTKEYSITCK